jgi:hypothetical protein
VQGHEVTALALEKKLLVGASYFFGL